MSNPNPRVRIPATASIGEVIEVKTLISHPMESGQRKDASGTPVPRKIIKQFVASFNGREIFRADWHPAISANPYHAFFVRVPETGTFSFQWLDDDGSIYKSDHTVTVT